MPKFRITYQRGWYASTIIGREERKYRHRTVTAKNLKSAINKSMHVGDRLISARSIRRLRR